MPEKSPSRMPEPMLIFSNDSKDQHNQGDTLPHYSESLRATDPSTPRWNQQFLATPGLLNVDFLAYLPSNATLSSDHTTVTVRDEQLVTVPTALSSFLVAQAALPPRPILRIVGSLNGDTEFDLKIDMMRYFVRERHESAWNYVKMVNKNEVAFRGESRGSVNPHCDTLLEWAQRFVKSSAGNKSFVLQREISNWNTKLLEGRIRTLLTSLVSNDHIEKIKDLTISFSATHTHLVILPPQTGLVNQFLSVLSPVKKFAVVKSVWPYANTAEEQRLDGIPRQCAVQSEDNWWRLWRPIIAKGVMSGKSGWLGIEDLMDLAMCGDSKSSEVI